MARKKIYRLFVAAGALALLLTFALVMAGCDSGSGGGAAKALVGTWESDYGITWSFTKNKFTQEMQGIKQTVSYKVKGDSIFTEYEGAEVEMDFEIDGDTLTVEVMGFELEFEKVE